VSDDVKTKMSTLEVIFQLLAQRHNIIRMIVI
jgi:hypothetical protein